MQSKVESSFEVVEATPTIKEFANFAKFVRKKMTDEKIQALKVSSWFVFSHFHYILQW